MKKQRIVVAITFAGGLDPDPVAAADALRKAGYEVTMMPEKFRSSLGHPTDYFMEASIDVPTTTKSSTRSGMRLTR